MAPRWSRAGPTHSRPPLIPCQTVSCEAGGRPSGGRPPVAAASVGPVTAPDGLRDRRRRRRRGSTAARPCRLVEDRRDDGGDVGPRHLAALDVRAQRHQPGAGSSVSRPGGGSSSPGRSPAARRRRRASPRRTPARRRRCPRAAGSSTPIAEICTKRPIPAGRAPSIDFSEPSRSTVRLRSMLPSGPPPAAKTTASQPAKAVGERRGVLAARCRGGGPPRRAPRAAAVGLLADQGDRGVAGPDQLGVEVAGHLSVAPDDRDSLMRPTVNGSWSGRPVGRGGGRRGLSWWGAGTGENVPMADRTDLLVIGAGPYAYSAAAYARDRGIDTRVVGPADGLLARPDARPTCSCAPGPTGHLDAAGEHTFAAYFEDRGLDPADARPGPDRGLPRPHRLVRASRRGSTSTSALVDTLDADPTARFVADDGGRLDHHRREGAGRARHRATSRTSRPGTTTCPADRRATPATSSTSTPWPAPGWRSSAAGRAPTSGPPCSATTAPPGSTSCTGTTPRRSSGSAGSS